MNKRQFTQERNYLVHPLYILITLILASVTALFLGFSLAYLYSRVQNGQSPISVPWLFYANSLFLLLASYSLRKTKICYEQDETSLYKRQLWITLGLTVVFLISQIIAWQQMYAVNNGLSSSTLTSYLYVISGIHFVHVIAGIPFMGYFIFDARKRLIEPASVLLYLSDPDKKRKLTVLSIYWHFLDGLWIYLVLFFSLNYLIG